MVKNMWRKSQSGQAIIMTVVAVGIVLAGGMGLAIDAGQLYGQRQMAQAAADAAAEAAIISSFVGTNTGTNAFGSGPYDCTTTDLTTPCKYAVMNGFGSTTADTVNVSFPTSVPGVTLSPDFTPAAVKVFITRNVSMTLMRLLGAPATMAVRATGTAVITGIVAAIPIIVTHPTLTSALQIKGGAGGDSITICGGPSQSIQVNSDSPTAVLVSGSATIDLSKAGPLDNGLCATGTGADFGTFGGPASSSTPSWLTPVGSSEHYIQPSLPIPDPFKSVAEPSKPANAPAPVTTGANTFAGAGDCPISAKQGSSPAAGDCHYYSPGNYPTGIQVQNFTAVFNPGLYYIDGVGSGSFKDEGFATGSNGGMVMCSATCSAAPADFSGGGMMVYLSTNGGVLHVPANSDVNLLGSDQGGTYKGILFFESRSAPTHTGAGSVPAHLLGGNGAMTLKGTVYLTNCDNSPTCVGTTMSGSNYQVLQLSGGAGSGTLVEGEIVVSVLQLGGGGAVKMNLNPSAVLTVSQIALVE